MIIDIGVRGSEPRVRELIVQAQRHCHQGSLFRIRTCLTSSPGQGRSALDSGDENRRLSSQNAMEERRSKAAAVECDDWHGHPAIGFLEAGKSVRALACLRARDVGSETNAIPCTLAGLINLSAKENVVAVKWFDRALMLDSRNAEALASAFLQSRQSFARCGASDGSRLL